MGTDIWQEGPAKEALFRGQTRASALPVHVIPQYAFYERGERGRFANRPYCYIGHSALCPY